MQLLANLPKDDAASLSLDPAAAVNPSIFSSGVHHRDKSYRIIIGKSHKFHISSFIEINNMQAVSCIMHSSLKEVVFLPQQLITEEGNVVLLPWLRENEIP